MRSDFLISVRAVDESDAAVCIAMPSIGLDFLHSVSAGALEIDLLDVALLATLAAVYCRNESRHFGGTIMRRVAARAASSGRHGADDVV